MKDTKTNVAFVDAHIDDYSVIFCYSGYYFLSIFNCTVLSYPHQHCHQARYNDVFTAITFSIRSL